MREILFRALANDGVWYYSDDEAYVLKEYEGILYLCENVKYYSNESTFELSIIGKAEQYTGLKDKNGVEIYEGDTISNPKYEESYVVEYAKTLAGYVGYSEDRIAGCYLITDDDIEVIGNLHDKGDN